MIPEKIIVYGIEYKILLVDGPICVNHHECRGSIAYEEAEIKILKSMDAQLQFITLFHEIGHAIAAHFDIWDLKDTEIEHVNDLYSKGFAAVLKNNPHIFKEGDPIGEAQTENIQG